ncbi:hypothetical protein [Pseudoduganella namucuonensis]|uniref:Type-F conjugative transfer system protein TrbI n=1 Tax=Pseudoduganella namucuonensis TaxID=1035707 RepID=A0A1I7M4E3_9BURK|nr:hypothetical protein [Pseudoduganella namucuonensis]SFV16747.1 hypothetical protein SAMN05216552_105513 [Pseudoduganella namucuonensis]
MKPALAGFLAALAVNAATLAGYHHWLVQPIPIVGVVDASRVYREEQERHLLAVSASPDDTARDKAIAAAKRFAHAFPANLAGLEHDCGCLVVDSSAIAAAPPSVPDLTAQLRQRVRP